MTNHSATDTGLPSSQQQHAISTRDLNMDTTSRMPSTVMRRAASPASSLPAENGNVTSQQDEQNEQASVKASTVIDAQPPMNYPQQGRTRSNPAREDKETSYAIFDEPRPDAGQGAAAVSSRWEATRNSSRDSSSSCDTVSLAEDQSGEWATQVVTKRTSSLLRWGWDMASLDFLPNEVLMHILGFLDVSDLLATSRINHHFRTLSIHPILHAYRLQRARSILPPLLTSPSRPTLAELIARHIFLTHTTQISRRLARNLVAIRLSRRLPQRPSAETLVQRGVLPPECSSVAPGLVAKKRAVEKERLKDGLRKWVGAVWRGEVRERSEGVKKWEESAGVGRVWRLRRFWERVGHE
ncbi:Uu.00g123060.m01.CDS01 [Anthostomella pinea]|uniref:Uu.00g123060.m01.CDS01 n=1 Tax=Anthostomella pinea TaxID=933095 RepID=A0AAI8VC20_9PEZI|nr:Uu.00g123060.m01.CDS01 [Anthostomella pinea]